MKLGSWLIARGKISGVQLKRALLDQSFYGGYLSSSLMKLGYLDEKTLGEYLAESFQVSYAGSSAFANIPTEVLRMIPSAVASKHRLVPLAVIGRKLQVATLNPRDILVLDEVAFLTGLPVEAWVTSESHMVDALEKFYQVPRSARQTIPLADEAAGEPGEDFSPSLPERSSSENPPGTPRPDPDELGLDGRPLSAPAEEVEGRHSSSPDPGAQSNRLPARAIPRSIEEWHSGEAATPQEVAAPCQDPLPSPSPKGGAGAPQSFVSAARTLPSPRSPLALVPPPPPASVEEVSLRLKNSTTRDEVFEALVGFCAARFARTALFVVMQERVIGWGGRGDGFDAARIRTTLIPFETPSIFSYFRMGSDFYFGPVPELPANQQFYKDLSLTVPDRVLVVPILIKGRLIALLYGDNGTGRREEPDIALFRRVAQKASLALEILILRNKIEMI
jgi:hypothetical protein